MALTAGARLGPYEVLGLIGAGGMGEVYRARDTRLGRTVAIKVLPADIVGDPDRRARFEREARTVARVTHPRICTLYDIGDSAGVMFLVMEHLEGETLARRLDRGPLPADQALALAAEIAEALRAAHGQGIIHRDLKPANVMLTASGAKLLDFGLARTETCAGSLPDRSTATGSVRIVGTAPYMSPEQATGRPVDARSDIFSFGCVLYEALSGHRAFPGETRIDAIAAVMRDTPPPIAGVPPGLLRILERCLAKNPDDRYQSVAELGAALASAGTAGPQGGFAIAVLPLVTMGGTPEDGYLCEGLAEAIIGALSGIEGLRVIARTSAFAVARQGLDVREIGIRLGVTHVLEGSLRHAGARIRVSVRLVAACDGTEIWSERYEHESPDVFALEDTIGIAVTRRLRGTVAGVRIGRSRTAADPAAHKAYVEGRYYFSRGGPVGLERARRCFEHAIALDASFALASDALAEVYWFFGFYGLMPPREAFSQSVWHAMRALELNDSLGQTHALLGMLRKELDYNWLEVHREMQRALELNPASPDVQVRNAISGLMPLGRLEEAEVCVRRALDVDPLSFDTRWWLACLKWLARQPEQTLEIGREMIEMDGTSSLGHSALGLGLSECGALDAAAAAMERAFGLSGGAPLLLGFAGQFQARAGHRDAALATVTRLEQHAAGRYLPPFSVALVYVGLGRWDEAFSWMNRAIDERDPIIMPIKTFPFLDGVRSDPRYADLVRRMNLDDRLASAGSVITGPNRLPD